MKKTKTYGVELVEIKADGGEIVINTDVVDRDRDRVFPAGAQIEDYMKNPVVQFGHNYRDPWATIGRTEELEMSGAKIRSKFTLRPPANDNDPQNIVRLLWAGEWIRTASIGFMPDMEFAEENEFGGLDFKRWDLLEWSLVPVPSNQEALREAVKTFGWDDRILSHYPITVDDQEVLHMSREKSAADIVTNFDGDNPARLYVVALPVDADPGIIFNDVKSKIDDPIPVGDPGQPPTGNNDANDDANLDQTEQPPSTNEPNNDEEIDETAFLIAIEPLTEILKELINEV